MTDYECPVITPAIKTASGLIRGYAYDGVYAFKGVQYGKAERFRSPELFTSEEVRYALAYGHVPPLTRPDPIANNFFVPHVFYPQDEDCLNLNIWTPTLDRGAKLPVVVSVFGGGFGAGSAIEMVAYEGDGLAKHQNLVVVNLNIRINLFGFWDLSELGGYWNSSSLGMEDMMLGLNWVKQSIEAFGGDPENVTLFGTQGGGARVKYALQIPAMHGLFQRVVNISGVADAPNIPTAESSAKTARAMLKAAGREENDLGFLETVSVAKLVGLYNDVTKKDPSLAIGWRPVKGDWYKGLAIDVGVCEEMKHIPVICGNTFAENSLPLNAMNEGRISIDRLPAAIQDKFGGAAEEICKMFRESYPEKDPRDVLYFNSRHRCSVLDYAQTLANSGVKTYVYLFAPTLGLHGGIPAYHCSDVPYLMHNVGKVPVAAAPGIAPKLEKEYSGAFAAFAAKGDPNFAGLANWPAFTAENQATMVFGEESVARMDYDGAFAKRYRSLIHDPRG